MVDGATSKTVRLFGYKQELISKCNILEPWWELRPEEMNWKSLIGRHFIDSVHNNCLKYEIVSLLSAFCLRNN